MQTIQLELNDDLYSSIIEKNIDIQAKFKEFLFHLTDDDYPAISSNEAKKRVEDAVDDYNKNGLTNFSEFEDDYGENLDTFIDNTKAS